MEDKNLGSVNANNGTECCSEWWDLHNHLTWKISYLSSSELYSNKFFFSAMRLQIFWLTVFSVCKMPRSTRSGDIPPPLPGNLRVFDSGPYPGSGEFDTKGTPGVQDLKRARVRWEIWTETVLKVSPAEYSQVSIFVIEEIQIWLALTPAQRTQYWR